MTMESIEDMVQRVVARHLGVPVMDVYAHQRVEHDLGLDPLDLVLIALRIEEIEHREFPVAQLEQVETVSDLSEILRSMRMQGAEGWLAAEPPARIHAHVARLARRATHRPASIRTRRAVGA